MRTRCRALPLALLEEVGLATVQAEAGAEADVVVVEVVEEEVEEVVVGHEVLRVPDGGGGVTTAGMRPQQRSHEAVMVQT